MRKLGYIEGYFGRLLSFQSRMDLLKELANVQQKNDDIELYWVYGPKEDPFHRIAWKQPYPESFWEDFAEFTSYAHELSIKVCAAVSPGLSFEEGNAEHLKLLSDKFARFKDHGADNLLLCMDDIEARGMPIDRKMATAHVDTLRGLEKELKQSFWFCPSLYCDEMCPEKTISASSYLSAISQLSPDINLLWTGPSVISKSITASDLAPIESLFSNIIIWDNFYANDFAPWQANLSEYSGRSKQHDVLINPTGSVFLDSLYLRIVSDWSHSRACNLQQHLEDLAMPRSLAQVWVQSQNQALSQKEIEQCILTLSHQLQFWQSEDKLDLYPLMVNLKHQLKARLKTRLLAD